MTEQPNHEREGWHLREDSFEKFRKEQRNVREIKPFRANHTFKSGTRLIGIENKEGVPEIQFLRDGKSLVDMQEYLPDGFTFTRKADPEHRLRANFWYTNFASKRVNVGDMDDPRYLLALLHEIGHAHDGPQEDLVQIAKLHEEAMTADDTSEPEKQTSARKVMQVLASRERAPWAYAVLTLRKIAEEAAFDVEELFSSRDDIKTFIHNYLESYRREVGLQTHELFPEQDFQEFAEELWDAFHGKGITEKKLHEDPRD